jgi:hypothetical protein
MTDAMSFVLGLVLAALAGAGTWQATGAAVPWQPAVVGAPSVAPAPLMHGARPAAALDLFDKPPVAKPAPAKTTKPRAKTSGEEQFEYGCAQGYIPASQCRGVAAQPPVAKPNQRQLSPGEAALRACVAQTGWTRAQCIADAQAGNAS